MSRLSRWWHRRRKKRRRLFIFGVWIGGGDEPTDVPDPIVPPDPYNGELALVSDTFNVTDTDANYVDIFVTRTNGFDGAVSVQYRLIPGTATAGVDYTDVSGTLNWSNLDQSQKSFRIPILARSVSGDFDFQVELHTPAGGATLALDTADVTIARRGNGEAAFAGAIYYKQNPTPAPSANLTLQVQRNKAFKDGVTVNWHTVNGTAIAGTDYTAGSGTLTWVNGDGAAKSIIIAILGRAGGPFGDRLFTVVLDTPTGGIVIASPSVATVTLTDGVPPANPSVSASYPNQIADAFYTASDEILAGDDFAVTNFNLLINSYAGSIDAADPVGNPINNVIDNRLTDLLAVSVFFASNVGVGVGNGGMIMRTADNGLTWFKPYGGTSKHLRAVYMASASVGWAVGDDGTIIKTTDGGNSWTAQTSGTTEHLYGIWAESTSIVYVVGANGTILRTSNGGTNWGAQTSGVSEHLRSVSTNGAGTGWVVGDSGRVLKTVNNGTNWNTQTSGTSENLRSVWVRDATNVWACGTNGKIIKGDGTNWASQNSGGGHLNSIAMISTTVGWAVGDSGRILKTTNGSTWSAQTSNTTKNLYGVVYTEVGANQVIAVGEDMTSDRTANGGTAWATVGTPAITIGPPFAARNGGMDYSNEDDTFAPTSRFALGGMIS